MQIFDDVIPNQEYAKLDLLTMSNVKILSSTVIHFKYVNFKLTPIGKLSNKPKTQITLGINLGYLYFMIAHSMF